MDILANTTRPDSATFYQRYDPNDVRLGEIVPQQTYNDAQIVLLGCPQDMGVERNKGRLGAKLAPDMIRSAFYKLTTFEAPAPKIFDLGNTLIQDTLEATHALHRDVVRQVLQDGKKLVVLGGGNDLSYADASALALEEPHLLGFNIDAHFDVRADTIPNSGTPYRQLLEEKYLKPEAFYEIAYQTFANSPLYKAYLLDKGVQPFSLEEVHGRGVELLLKALLEEHHSAKAIFWGLDMDVVRAADAPGVSAPNPTGLTGEEFCQIAALAGSDSRTRIFEITEVNPNYDIDGRTARLAAVAIYHFMLNC